jgi:hypothetical protein
MSFWWEMNNKKWGYRVPTTSSFNEISRELNMDFCPVMYVMHCNPENDSAVTVTFQYDYTVYYRDPLH